jgi:hypothetical protein
MISWALSKERRGIYYTYSCLAQSAHFPYKTAGACAGLHLQQDQHKQNGTAHEDALLFSPASPPTSLARSATVSRQDVIVFPVCVRTVYDARTFRAGPNSLPLSIHLSAGFAVIRVIVS